MKYDTTNIFVINFMYLKYLKYNYDQGKSYYIKKTEMGIVEYAAYN